MAEIPEIVLLPGAVDTADCAEVMRRLWEFLDGELTDEKMEMMRLHLSLCEECYGNYDFARKFLVALHQAQSENRMSVELRRRVLDMLRSEGFTPRFGEDEYRI